MGGMAFGSEYGIQFNPPGRTQFSSHSTLASCRTQHHLNALWICNQYVRFATVLAGVYGELCGRRAANTIHPPPHLNTREPTVRFTISDFMNRCAQSIYPVDHKRHTRTTERTRDAPHRMCELDALFRVQTNINSRGGSGACVRPDCGMRDVGAVR